MDFFFGILLPYAALAIFFLGVMYRVVTWARSPVPFRIPTTGGQQKSHPWIKANPVDNPSGSWGVVARMALEVLIFRSLMRNTRAELRDGPKLAYHWEKWLWLSALLFHWSLAVVLLRHLRLFLQPVPAFVSGIEALDGFFRIGVPVLYLTDITIVLGMTYLFIRRIVIPQVKYISLPADYFLPLLILSVAGSGILMRYVYKVDIVAVKQLVLGWVTFSPVVPKGIGMMFAVHISLVSVLVAYLPFSKLTHMMGVFLTPTRNQANDSRAERHINPWNAPVQVHTYEEYEHEFGAKMRAAGIPLDHKEGA